MVMPMGRTNVPEVFMQTRTNLLMDMLVKKVIVFLDDILIYSIIVEEHFKLLKKVFTYLHKTVFYFKLKKCSFLQKTSTSLGFDIPAEGLHISDAKV